MNRNPKSKWNEFWSDVCDRLITELKQLLINYNSTEKDAIRFYNEVFLEQYGRIINYNTSRSVINKINDKIDTFLKQHFGFSNWQNAKVNAIEIKEDDMYWAGKFNFVVED